MPVNIIPVKATISPFVEIRSLSSSITVAEETYEPICKNPSRKVPDPRVKNTYSSHTGMPHRIEVFTGNCPLCRSLLDDIEAGKCSGCSLVSYNMSENPPQALHYEVRVVPTVVIDGEIKIEGKPDMPFVCDNDTYAHFRKKYPLRMRP